MGAPKEGKRKQQDFGEKLQRLGFKNSTKGKRGIKKTTNGAHKPEDD
jgi:hypothetical protein